MKKIIKGIGKSLISPVGIGLWAADSEFNNPVTDGTMEFQRARERQDLINKLPKETRKKLKTFSQFKEEMMSTGSDANSAGFSQESPEKGPTAGLTMPFMSGMVTRSNKSPWIKPAIEQGKKKKNK